MLARKAYKSPIFYLKKKTICYRELYLGNFFGFTWNLFSWFFPKYKIQVFTRPAHSDELVQYNEFESQKLRMLDNKNKPDMRS